MAEVPKKYFDRYFLVVGVVCVFVALLAALQIRDSFRLEKAEADAVRFFKEFRVYEDKFYLPSIRVAGPDGDIIDLRDNDGKYTVLNIWATWCTPCVKELPSLRKLSTLLPYDSGWRVIAVSVDAQKDIPKVIQFTTRYKVTNIAAYHDYNMDLQKKLNIRKLPMTLIISKSGQVLYEIYGDALWHDDAVRNFLYLVKNAR